MPLEDTMRPVFMISVAAELAEMHPQTLRMYERRGLIRPGRSAKSTRLYSLDDVERLRRIQQLVTECGLNLAGVERVLDMEQQMAALQRQLDQLRTDMDRLTSRAREELEAVHRSYRKELVPVSNPGAVVVVDQAHAGQPVTVSPLDDHVGGHLNDDFGDDPDADFDATGPVLEPAREQPCANHPNRLTYVTCNTCGKPLCPDCMIYSAVGIKCRECARMPRSSMVTLKSHRLLAAAAAGLGTGTAVGFVYYYILGAGRFFFLIFFIAAGIGWLVGEAVVRASGHYHGVKTASIAAASTVWAFIVPPLFSVFLNMGFGWSSIVFGFTRMTGIINWIVMAVATYFAWHRNR